MSDKSKIEWTDATWNPIRARNKKTGQIGHWCQKVSPGCAGCYAERMQPRFGNPSKYNAAGLAEVELLLDEKVLTQPLRWRRPRMIFVCSMTDLFGNWVPQSWIDRIFAVMALARQHTFQVLTKRAGALRYYFRNGRGVRFFGPGEEGTQWMNRAELIALAMRGTRFDRRGELSDYYRRAGQVEGKQAGHWPLPNVWLGVSAEDQERAEKRVPHLLQCPAAVRFVSAEPLLGLLDVSRWLEWAGHCANCGDGDYWGGACCDEPLKVEDPRLDWVIAGGESGPKARPCHSSSSSGASGRRFRRSTTSRGSGRAIANTLTHSALTHDATEHR